MNGPEFVDDWVVGNNRVGMRCSDESDGPDEDRYSEVPMPVHVNIGIFSVTAKREAAEENEKDAGKDVQTKERSQRVEIDVLDLNCGSGDERCERSNCGNANLSRHVEYGCDRGDYCGDKCCGDKEVVTTWAWDVVVMVVFKEVKTVEVMLTIVAGKERGRKKDAGKGSRSSYIPPPPIRGLAIDFYCSLKSHQMETFHLLNHKSVVINFPFRFRPSQIYQVARHHIHLNHAQLD